MSLNVSEQQNSAMMVLFLWNKVMMNSPLILLPW